MVHMKKLNSKGFGHIELVLVTLVLIAVGGIGAFVMARNSSAAGTPDYKVRFIGVVPSNVTVPHWATNGTVKDNALSIQSWYGKRVGKNFAIATSDPQNYQKVTGKKTLYGYKQCPSNFKCPDGAADAITANLYNEFRKPGMSTVIFFAIDPFVSKNIYSSSVSMNSDWNITNVKDSAGYVKNYGLVAVNFTGTINNYVGDAKARRYTAHELGHTMGLGHVCNKTLMNKGQGVEGCTYIATSWPDTPLQSSQASALNANSRFFNDL